MMSEPATLESLAEHDPVTRPLALLHLEVLAHIEEPARDGSLVNGLDTRPAHSGIPVLHNARIAVDERSAGQLLSRLALALDQAGVDVSLAAAGSLDSADPIRMLKAAIESNETALTELALEYGLEPPVLSILGQCLAMPALISHARQITFENGLNWDSGFCPTCGAWPTIAELRGLDRQLWLRCGRCSAAWSTRHQQCIYCRNTDHTSLGYLAAESERESRRVVTCEQCKGYFKSLATVAPFSIAELLYRDLASLELDVAAMDAGYARPDHPGFPIEVDVVGIMKSDT
jgi:FdhE protein